MRCAFLPIWDGKGDKHVAYIGPSQNLKPETRRHLSPIDKQQILQRQCSRCNCCGERIRLYPSANCDADHIVGVCRGGKTTLENIQLLCVQDHRAKSAREAQGASRMIDVGLEPGDTSVYIFASGTIQFPVDKRTPLEAIQNGRGLSLLTFKESRQDVYRGRLRRDGFWENVGKVCLQAANGVLV
ncbi:unnamed protein product [Laminaria digitata]